MAFNSSFLLQTVSGYHGELPPGTSNLNGHTFSHSDIARMFDDSSSGLRDISRTLFDSMPYDEHFSGYANGFMEPTLHSSFSMIEANNLEDSSLLETYTSEALYTNNLSQKEADALSFAGISSPEVLHYCLVNFLDMLDGDGDLLSMLVSPMSVTTSK